MKDMCHCIEKNVLQVTQNETEVDFYSAHPLIICINLQMWLSFGFEVAEFAFFLDPYVNVSKLFQRRQTFK